MLTLLPPRLRMTGGVAYSGSSFTSRFGTLYGVARCEEGVDHAGPEEDEFEEDEYVLLGWQRAAAEGDGGGEGGISSLGTLL
jgi:hypothetical protein